MHKGKLIALAGLLVAGGVAAAISAPGPRGGGGAMEFDHDGIGQADMGHAGMGHGRREGHRGWFGPRSITSDEYDTQIRERFARLDKNSDGVLDATEIEAALQAHAGGGWRGRGHQGGAMTGGDDFLRRFGDKDGKVTKDAFMSEAARRFDEMDLNNDGKISDDDLPPMLRGKGALRANGAMMPGPMAMMLGELRKADVKQDGVITREAYLSTQAQRFAELDRNKDGVVDKADFDALRKEMTDYQLKRFLHAYGADTAGKVTKEQYFKVAKERFARLDPKGEGKITLGGPGRAGGGRGWFGHHGGHGPSPDGDRAQMPPDGDRASGSPKN